MKLNLYDLTLFASLILLIMKSVVLKVDIRNQFTIESFLVGQAGHRQILFDIFVFILNRL
jgi:hypothetical protein